MEWHCLYNNDVLAIVGVYMSVETELKLHIAPEHLIRLKCHPLLKNLSIERATTRKLYNVYYDTAKLELRRHEMALRLRRMGKQWLQTLKTGGGVHAGLHQRNEWEMSVSGEALDYEALKACGGMNLTHSLRKKLRPIFVTEFSRSIRLVAFNGAEIELSMDSGEVRAGERCSPISELELELKSGEPLQLFKLALVLFDIVPLEVEHISKAEYGYRLFSHAKTIVTRMAMPSLSKVLDVPGALQTMIGACLLHLHANVPGAVQRLDEEYLHQVRVALRRLRVVLSMARIFCADTELSYLNEQVTELCVEFGRLREWDVFVTQVLLPIRAQLSKQDRTRLLAASEEKRIQHHAILESRLQSQDYQRFLLRFGAWMHGDYWRPSIEQEQSLSQFAIHILDKRSQQVDKRAKHLVSASPEQLHILRIACKKLRYSAEIFATLFDQVKTKSYLSTLTTMQDTLGILNDIEVSRRLLSDLDAGTQHKSTILIRGFIERDYQNQIIKLSRDWKLFSEQTAFWSDGCVKKAGVQRVN